MDFDEFERCKGKVPATGVCCKPDAHLGATESPYMDDEDLYDYYGFPLYSRTLNTLEKSRDEK